MKASIRKGCNWCAMPLRTFKEKVLRTCDTCAQKALNSIDTVSKGNIKEGFNQFKQIYTDQETKDKTQIDKKIKTTLNRKQQRIIKLAKKQGIDEETTIQALKQIRS